MNVIFKRLCFIIFVLMSSATFAYENIFYVLRNNGPLQITLIRLKEHYRSIDMVISQAYQIDQKGNVWGHVNPDIMNFIKEHHLKLVAMITNANFDKQKSHQFLTNNLAQQQAIQTIINECKKNQYYGVQFDFEMIPLQDKKILTHFLQVAALELHRQGFFVSFAVAPLVGDHPQSSEFLRRSYTIWEGAYDLKVLGESGDLITIMTYDQHTEGTTPGPIASFKWVEQAIKYAVHFIPKQKISLGIPSYSSYWYTGVNSHHPSGRLTMRMAQIDYERVKKLLLKHHAILQWSDVTKVNSTSFQHDWLEEYIFIENAKSFQAKLALVKKYNLRGISVFRLGIEDPEIWKTL